MATFKAIIENAVMDGLGLPKDPIPTDIRDIALATLNTQGKVIWLSWPWDNEKLDEFTVPSADADGIVVFGSDVEAIRGIRPLSDDGDPCWNADELIAISSGSELDTEQFVYLADANGCRRIKLLKNTAGASFKALALRRWVDAVVDPDYDSNDPDATPTDYRVLEFPLDRAEPAVGEFVKDALRAWSGESPRGQGSSMLQVAQNRENEQQERNRRCNPRAPLFEEAGNW